MKSLILEPSRLGTLMKNDIVMTATTRAITMASALGVIFVINLLSAGFGFGFSHQSVFSGLLVIGGFLLTSVSFIDIHEPKKAMHYLTLPGSLLEKYVARVLVTTIGWIVVATVAYIAVSALSAAVAQPLFGRNNGVFLPADLWAWQAIGGYIIANSAFVFGAVYFKKAAFVKVVLASILFGIAYAVFAGLAGRLVFIDRFAHFIPTGQEMMATFGEDADISTALGNLMGVFGKIFSWVIVPVFFWVIGYRRLRETEV